MPKLLLLAYVCAKCGLLGYGGGMGMVPLMHAEAVTHYGWLTEKQFIDGVAMGQVTPGPLMVTATFVGWKVAGVLGAVVATVSIFAPSAFLAALACWQLSRVRNNRWVQGFLEGVRPATAGLLGAIALKLAHTALFLPGQTGVAAVDLFAVALCLGALVLLVRYKMDAALLILLGGMLGLAASQA